MADGANSLAALATAPRTVRALDGPLERLAPFRGSYFIRRLVLYHCCADKQLRLLTSSRRLPGCLLALKALHRALLSSLYQRRPNMAAPLQPTIPTSDICAIYRALGFADFRVVLAEGGSPLKVRVDYVPRTSLPRLRKIAAWVGPTHIGAV